jgi:acetyl esterase/lipase
MGLISPWADFAPAYPSYRRNGWYDFLAPQRLVKAIDSAMRWYAPFMRKNVWFSPAKASKGDWSYLTEWNVDMHLTLGTRELFEDEIRLLSDVMERDGVEVRLYEVSSARDNIAKSQAPGRRSYRDEYRREGPSSFYPGSERFYCQKLSVFGKSRSEDPNMIPRKK